MRWRGKRRPVAQSPCTKNLAEPDLMHAGSRANGTADGRAESAGGEEPPFPRHAQ